MKTDEERKKFVADLRELGEMADWGHSVNDKLKQAANEIERLQRELNSTLNLLYQESERRAKAEHGRQQRLVGSAATRAGEEYENKVLAEANEKQSEMK